MKKQIALIITATVFMLLSPETTEASNLIQEDGITPNHSAEYVRTLNRHASCDADAAFYNPAGLAFFEVEGLYLMFSNQTFYFNREHSMRYYAINVDGVSPNTVSTAHQLAGDSFKSNMPERYAIETTEMLLPDINLIWKGTDMAAFFSFNVLHAAPSLIFETGLATVDWGILATVETMLEINGSNDFISYYRNEELIREEMFIGATAGFTHTVGRTLSLALAVRYINATGKMRIHVSDVSFYADYGSGPTLTTPDPSMTMDWNIETDTKGQGAGVIGGIHVKPLEGVDIGLRYEYYFPLVMDKKTVHFSAPILVENTGHLDIFKDGKKSPDGMAYTSADTNGRSEIKVTYPQTLACGVSTMLKANLRAEVSGTAVLRPFVDLDGVEDKFNIGFSAGGALEWSLWPEFKLSAGYVYNNTGLKPEARDEQDPMLNHHTVGGGFGFQVNDMLSMSAGLYNVFYPGATQFTSEFTNVSGPTNHYLEKKYYESRFSAGIGFTLRLF